MREKENKDIFNRYNLRNTKQRNLILNILKDLDRPITAEEIFIKAKGFDETISFSTIYRVLNAFIGKDLVIKRSLTEDKKTMFELSHDEHRHYVVCVSCNKMVKIAHCPLEDYEKSVQKTTEFSIIGHKLEVYGYCPECKNKK